MDKMKWLFIALPILIIVFLINSNQQNKLGSNSDQIFEIEKEDIFFIDISKADEIINLFFDGQSWSIEGNDTLIVKENSIDSFFNSVVSPFLSLPNRKSFPTTIFFTCNCSTKIFSIKLSGFKLDNNLLNLYSI